MFLFELYEWYTWANKEPRGSKTVTSVEGSGSVEQVPPPPSHGICFQLRPWGEATIFEINPHTNHHHDGCAITFKHIIYLLIYSLIYYYVYTGYNLKTIFKIMIKN